ncbi:MAG: GNAT family N-acetyltransferase [Sphaerochaetaceae bacterium]
MNTLTFREEPVEQDIQIVASLLDKTHFFTPEEQAVGVEVLLERLKDGLQSGYQVLFAQKGQQVAGYACYGKIPMAQDGYDLYWIAVDPLFQNQKIGYQLLTRLEQNILTQGGKRLYLETSGKDQYIPTQRFYERNGFILEAQQKDYYAPGDNRLLYVKYLGNHTSM